MNLTVRYFDLATNDRHVLEIPNDILAVDIPANPDNALPALRIHVSTDAVIVARLRDDARIAVHSLVENYLDAVNELDQADADETEAIDAERAVSATVPVPVPVSDLTQGDCVRVELNHRLDRDKVAELVVTEIRIKPHCVVVNYEGGARIGYPIESVLQVVRHTPESSP